MYKSGCVFDNVVVGEPAYYMTCKDTCVHRSIQVCVLILMALIGTHDIVHLCAGNGLCTDRYLHASGMRRHGNVQSDGSLFLLTEELVFKESGYIIVDGDLYRHAYTTCHRAISQLGQSLEKKE